MGNSGIEDFNILKILQTVCDSGNQQNNLYPLIKYCNQIASKYINHKYSINELFIKFNCGNQEVILEAISPLFIHSEKCGYLGLKKALTQWHKIITTEEDATFFLETIVKNRIDQHIYELLKENDPSFTRILKKLNYQIRINRYYKIHWLGIVYIVENENQICGNIIDSDTVMKLPFEVIKNSSNVLKDFFYYLKNSTSYYPAVPINAFIRLLKKIEQQQMNVYLFEIMENRIEEQYEISDIITNSIEVIIKKLKNDYIDKGKLSICEAQVISSILMSYGNDIMNGNTGYLYEYVRNLYPEISQNIYEEKYHNILDYLIRLLKKFIIRETSF